LWSVTFWKSDTFTVGQLVPFQFVVSVGMSECDMIVPSVNLDQSNIILFDIKECWCLDFCPRVTLYNMKSNIVKE